MQTHTFERSVKQVGTAPGSQRRLAQGLKRCPAPGFELRGERGRRERAQVGDRHGKPPRGGGVCRKLWNAPSRLGAFVKPSECARRTAGHLLQSRCGRAVSSIASASHERARRDVAAYTPRKRFHAGSPRFLSCVVQCQKRRESFGAGVLSLLVDRSALRAGVSRILARRVRHQTGRNQWM